MDVFISYSRADQEIVRLLAEAVTREGYSVWWDADLPPHRAYGDVITEEIGGAKAAIAVWSRTAAASEWVRAEADVARNQKKLIQTSIDGSMPPMPFNQIQFASLEGWRGEADHPGWRKVMASLSILCGDNRPMPTGVPLPGDRPGAVAAAAAPPTAPAPATGGRSHVLLIVILLVLVIAGAVTIGLLWGRGDRVKEVVRVEREPGRASARGADGDRGPRGARGPSEEGAGPIAAPMPRNAAAAPVARRAVIEDPDGFTNVRSAPAGNGAIVARIEEGQRFLTRPQPGLWWQVRLADGTTGWVHRSRIRLVD